MPRTIIAQSHRKRNKEMVALTLIYLAVNPSIWVSMLPVSAHDKYNDYGKY